MKCNSAKSTSLALGSTIAILYTLCALVMAIAPGAAFAFVNNVAHGVNLSALETGAPAFTFGQYLSGLLCITAYTMIAGYIYGVARNAFARRESAEPTVVRRNATASA